MAWYIDYILLNVIVDPFFFFLGNLKLMNTTESYCERNVSKCLFVGDLT